MVVSLLLLVFPTLILTQQLNFTFPHDFMFGAATSAYQMEGAWNVDGKGLSTWDVFVHKYPEKIVDRSTGDISSDSYNKYKEDIKALKHMGMEYYRFSIAWTRIFPTGLPHNVNKKGIEHYNNLINEVVKNGITPLVTMHHFDLPQYLFDLGGWTNDILIDYFEAFAKILFENFGDRVKHWTTFNEPHYAVLQYEDQFGPGINASGIGPYFATHNILKSHARVYHLYDKFFRNKQQGKISITLNVPWADPMNKNSSQDKEAAERHLQFYLGWFAHPIYSKEGDYPLVMKERIANISKDEGFPSSRLPTFSPEEVKYIKGTSDFFSLNEYYADVATPGEDGPIPSLSRDEDVLMSIPKSWPTSHVVTWESVTPKSIRNTLDWISKNYGDQWEIIITENGFGDDGRLNDTDRENYLATYMIEILKAIHIDKCNVKGYIIWSLIDGWEFIPGYTYKYGLYQVDFNDPERKRTPRQSAEFMRNVTKTKTIPSKYTELDTEIDSLEDL